MIIKASNFECLNKYEKTDIFSVRVLALAKAYGFSYDFVSFYCQVLNDEVTAVISYLETDVTVSVQSFADKEEIKEFIKMRPFTSVLTDETFDLDFNFEYGEIMKSSSKIEFENEFCQIDMYPKLMDLFDFINYEKQDFSAWYVDLCHRIRHGCAKAYALKIEDEIISSAIFSFIFENNAILTSVKTENAFRKMGYASVLISKMLCDFNGTVYLMRDKDRNENFYKKLGFKNIGQWRMF